MSLDVSNQEGVVHPVGGGGGGKRGWSAWVWIALLGVLLFHIAMFVLLSRLGIVQTPLTPPDVVPPTIFTFNPPAPPPPPPAHPRTRPTNPDLGVHNPTSSTPASSQPVQTSSSQPSSSMDRVSSEPPRQPTTSDQPAVSSGPPVITQPNWLRQPNADQLTRFYPAQALDQEIQGRAVIRCRVTVSGTLTSCVILSEKPPGYGFGRAALALSVYFRMTPRTEDGRPVEGGQVDVPINFRL